MPLDSAARMRESSYGGPRASFLICEGAAVSAMRNPVRLVSTWPRAGRAVLAAASVLLLLAAGAPSAQTGAVQFVGKTKYLNNARAVVAHTIDDSTKLVVDTARRDGQVRHQGHVPHQHRGGSAASKSGFTTSCRSGCCGRGCEKAVENGHELGAHARDAPVPPAAIRPDQRAYRAFCDANYNDDGAQRDRGT